MSNILAGYGKINDLYVIITIAFDSSVTWYPGHDPSSIPANADVADGGFVYFLICNF